MKKTWKSLVGVLLLSLVAIGTPAHANPLSVTPGSIYIDLGIMKYALSSSWTGDNPGLDHSAYSCMDPMPTAVTSPTTSPSLSTVLTGKNCKELSMESDGSYSLDGREFDLSNAYYEISSGTWVSYDPQSHNRHIIMVTELIDSSTTYYIHTASSYLFPSEAVTLGSFLLDGNDVTHIPTSFSKFNGLNWDYLVACAVGINPIEKTEPRLIGEIGTGVVPLTEDGGFNCARLFDANNNPTDPDSLVGGVVTSLGNAVFHDGTEFVSFSDSGRKWIALETFYADNDSGQGEKWFTNTDFVEYIKPSSQQNPPNQIPGPPPTKPSFSAPAPFQGPVIATPSIPTSNAPGSTISIPGENLDGVSSVTIGDTEAEVVVGENLLTVTIPETLSSGTYDLVISSSTGNVTISDAITVSGVAVNASEAPRGSTNREDDEVKVRVFNPAGAGKVQIIVNGEEIAWVRTDDPNDPKLFNGYLVRTVKLEPGKNVIEIFLDGERIRRNAYGL